MSIERLRATNKWKHISSKIKLSENTIRRNQLNVSWPDIFKYQKVSVTFIREFISKVTDQDLWDVIAQYQTLDNDFIEEYRANLNWNIVLKYQSLTTRFIPADNAIASDVQASGPDFVFTFPKSRFRSTIEDMQTYTTMDVFGANVSANNKSYNITDVSETDTTYLVTTDTTYTLAGADPNELGWATFPESEVGDTSFLANANIIPYLHKGNNVSRPFKNELSEFQSLTESYIVTNYSNLNASKICESQFLTDRFVANYSDNSTLTDAVASLTLDHDQLVINQDLDLLLTEPMYTDFIKDYVNKQLLLKYQNLSKQFILDNITDLQLEELGKYNKNLSDEDLQQIEDDNPFLTETTDRPGTIRFEYDYGDIVEHLKTAGFDFEEGLPVGYVFYHRNGSLPTKRKINLDVVKGTEVSTSQVDLDEDNPRARNGITVLSGKDVIKNPERQSFKIAKVSVPIVSRNIGRAATGSISFSQKNRYNTYDRFNLGDDNGKKVFEMDLTGSGTRSETVIFNSNAFNSVSNVLTTTNPHRFNTGDPVEFSGSLPSPLLVSTTYYVIVTGTNTLQVAANKENAIANIPLTVADGSGNILRKDNSFAIITDIKTYTGMPVLFPTVDAGIAPITSGNTNYRLIKISDHLIQVAESEEDAKNNLPIQLTGYTTSYTMVSNVTPINLRSTDIVRGLDVANVINRMINNLKVVTLDGSPLFYEADPWYPTVKNGEAEYVTNFEDYTSTFTADQLTNRLTLATNIPFTTGDRVTFTGGSLPSPIMTGQIYYVIVINSSTIELADDLEDAQQGISISLTASGSGNIFPTAVTLSNTTNLHTGNKVEVASASLPTNISAATVYYVNVLTPTKIEFCSSANNAYNGVPIHLQRTGSSAKTITAEDYNMEFGAGGKAIVHFIDGNNLYVEVVGDVEIGTGVSANSRNSVSTRNIDAVVDIINVSSTQNLEKLSLTSTLDDDSKSQGNITLERFTDDLNTIKVSGMRGGFEDTIIDANARGVGVIIEELNRLRAFSVTMIDNDYYDELRF